MTKYSRFLLYGEGQPQIEEAIQPRLSLRDWSDLKTEEKEIALQHIMNSGWIESNLDNIITTIEYLNHTFLRKCRGKTLHNIGFQKDRHGDNKASRRGVALGSVEIHREFIIAEQI